MSHSTVSAPEPVNVLLVDDLPANLLALEAALADLGQNLVKAHSGEDALSRLLADDFAVVLLDVKMPGVNGFEVARLIRRRARSRATPIIFLTAHDGAGFSAEQAYALGAVDYLVKPLVPVVLRAKVAGFVEVYQKTERLRKLERAEGERRLAEERQRWALERAQEEVARQKRRAEELAELGRRKDEFLALLGHELRNPLAPIRNAVHVLRQAGADRTSAEQARGVIERQVGQLSRLVDDLLDVARITHGKITLHKQPMELGAAVAHAIETCRPLIDARGHDLAVELPTEAVWLDADPARLTQVVVNLLTNAAKYTPPQGHIRLSATRTAEQIVLRVGDNGAGIPADMLERVFDKFTQVERAPGSASQWGLGVGLSLVKALVEMHGGSVVASSAGPGLGSEFVVCLPVVLAPPTGSTPSGSELVPVAGRPLRVLIVDDHADGAQMLAELLRLGGHEARTAQNGQAALEVAATWPPQAVVLDIGLPGMDGYEVARRLRQQDSLREALLVALTGYGGEDHQRRAREAGLDHFLTKPAEPAELQHLLLSKAGEAAISRP